MKYFRIIWNIITGKDQNKDGKVDIKDAMIKAKKNVKITTQNIGE
jgi:hypothetical protein